MDETKEIEFSKVLDLVYCAVDFDWFDETKILDVGVMKDPTSLGEELYYFYGYSYVTSSVWFYNNISIRNGELYMDSWFIEKWKNHKYVNIYDSPSAYLDRLIEIQDKRLKIINLPN